MYIYIYFKNLYSVYIYILYSTPHHSCQKVVTLDSRRTMAEWINSMPADNLPSELHLSHNRITPSGFHNLVQAIEPCLQDATRYIYIHSKHIHTYIYIYTLYIYIYVYVRVICIIIIYTVLILCARRCLEIEMSTANLVR
jgi:hypothetical protein